MPTYFAIQGRRITLPVEVRRASAWSATFTVPIDRARKLIPDALEPATIAGRAIASLAFVRYEDSDLDAYNELAFSIGVRAHDAKPATPFQQTLEVLRGKVRVYIRHLPVNQEFTLEAGRSIWGYPKWRAEISIVDDGKRTWCTLSENGNRVLALGILDGGTFRLPQRSTPTYSDAGGELNLTSWNVAGAGRGRLGGATLRLGTGELADELRSLGLPKRALLTTTVPNLRATFGAAQRV